MAKICQDNVKKNERTLEAPKSSEDARRLFPNKNSTVAKSQASFSRTAMCPQIGAFSTIQKVNLELLLVTARMAKICKGHAKKNRKWVSCPIKTSTTAKPPPFLYNIHPSKI